MKPMVGGIVLNKKGYSIKEMVILCSVLAVLFGIGIVKTSYAYEQINKEDEIMAIEEKNLITIAELYVKNFKDKFQEAETYFYGKELIDNQYLINTDNIDFSNTKIKVSRNIETDEYKVELAD